MDEYAASRSHLEKLVAAAQSIKESLICRICLEYFKEPVTIKCGHKFCHNCIITVANGEHATCPFCNLKIQKRSIPKNGNILLQACVDQFDVLVKAITSDSGIDVLETYKNIIHKKKSVLCDKPSTSKVEESSNASKESSSTTNKKSLKSKANLRRDSKLSLQKKRVSNKLKSSSDKKNPLDKYLSNTHECTDNQVPSNEKVKIWLENHTPSGSIIRNSDNEDSPPIVKKLCKEDTTQKLPITQSEQNVDSLINACSSKDKLIESKVSIGEFKNKRNNDSPYKEVQLRVQEVEMIAKKKKASFSVPDKTVLRTPSSVPAASHSDAYDWRRIKKVGKEMQIKTFKSLNVSVEKSSSSIALDDTVICNSTNNDKNTSRESDTNNHSCNNAPSEITQKKLFRDSHSTRQKENLENVEDCNHKQHFINSSGSQQEGNMSLFCTGQKQVNDIIDIVSENDVNTPEKTRNALNVSNQEYLSKLNQLSPLDMNLDNNQQNSSSDDKSLKIDSKSSTNNIQNTPLPKNKLSLKMKLTPSTAKPVRSQPSTPDKTHHISNQSPKDISPERPRSRLSLRLPNTKSSECSSNKSKSTKISRSIKSNTYNKKSLNSSNRPVIVFKKLGKICKKRKNVPFLHLGKLKMEGKKIFLNLNKQNTSGIIIKSNIPVNVDYKPAVAKMDSKPNSISLKNVNTEVKLLSPEKDSQLKFLAIESPQPKQYTNVEVNSSQHINATNYELISMEVDEEIPMNEILDHHLDFQQEIIKNDRNIDTKIEIQSPQSKISENILEKNTKKKVILMEDENSSKTSPSMIRMLDVLYINHPGTSSNVLNQEIDDDLKKSENEERTCSIFKGDKINNNEDKTNNKEDKTNNKEDDVISISSNGSTAQSPSSHKTVHSENVDSKQKNMNKKCIIESSAESESSSTSSKSEDTQRSGKKSTCTKASTSSSSVMASPLKKKRTFSESSNDDDDVSSIIGKWVGTVEEPIIKRPKITSSTKRNFSPNQNQSKSKRIEDSCADDDDDNTLVDVDCKQPDEINKPESDSSIDNIISKVKHYRDNITDSNKLIGVPSSLSADMFESNEKPIQSRAKILPKLSNEVNSDNSSVCTLSPIKKTDKENVNTSQDLSEVTMLDVKQFDKKKSNISENVDGSDKENNECNQTNANTVFTKISNDTDNRKNEIESSEKEKNNQSCQINPYQDSDSLMNITQEQLAFKNIEKALGLNMSSIQHDKNEETFQPNEFQTPKKVKSCQKNNIDDFDSDNIDATPVVKRRHTYINSRKSKVAQNNEEEKYLQDRVSPDKNFDLIPAITPVKNTKSYPIGHSTPMVITSVKNQSATQSEIVLVCSSLDLEKMKTVHNFVNKFGAKFESNFSTRITHVIVSSDPSTKTCNKTFKYIQGIAYNKYVISFQWIVDCLNENRLLNEDDAKYEVLDPDVLEPGSTKSRTISRKLFEGFAMFCFGSFTSFPVNEFKDLLLYNGAVIVNSPQALSLQNDKFRMVIFDVEDDVLKQLHTLKKSRGALVSFEWVVDSISQYQITSLFTYLCETTIEEALALGFPPEYLVEETTIEEEEEKVEM